MFVIHLVIRLAVCFVLLGGLVSCQSNSESVRAQAPSSEGGAGSGASGTSTETDAEGVGEERAANATAGADVIEVSASGDDGSLTFSVTVKSPDTGCDRYADWWEVVSQDGELLYRRILLHSHTDEQPFTRSGGPVPVAKGETVIVRAHMSSAGYGGQALRGSPAAGFSPADLQAPFAAEVEHEPPQPDDCAF